MKTKEMAKARKWSNPAKCLPVPGICDMKRGGCGFYIAGNKINEILASF